MLKILKGLTLIACRLLPVCCAFFLASCATHLGTQTQVSSFLSENNYSQAVSLLEKKPNIYGKKNSLLYLLDKGYVLHLAGDYKQSIETFAKAKQKFDELYTKSVTGILSTWLVNEYTAPYRGEDFESVMVNLFQSLNYIVSGSLEDALVEARDVDSKLSAINKSYSPDLKNVYREDAFVRLLMGVIYEANMSGEDYNNAFISYAKAAEIYERDYANNYNLCAPQILKENILAAAEFMGQEEFNKYHAKYGNVKFLSLNEKSQKAEVYLIQYNGPSPVKVEDILPVSLPDGYIAQIAFPRYRERPYFIHRSILNATDERGKVFKTASEIGEDVGAIAIKNLNNRKARVIAKAVASQAGKYFLERKQEENINKKYGRTAGLSFNIISNLFNIFSSRADLRCWQTLPSEVRIARLILEPGEYNLSVSNLDSGNKRLGESDLGKVKLQAGQKKFFIVSTLR